MEQQDLFGMPPILARPADPVTSYQAAQAILKDLPRLIEWTASCVRQTPGLTQRELGARHCPEDLRKIGRRLAECARRGVVRRGMSRKCSITGRQAETWWPPGE